MPSDSSTRATAPISESVFFSGSEKQKLRQLPVRANRAENFVVLHLPGHDGAGDAFLMQQFERARQLAQADPVQSRRDFLELRRSLFANRDHGHVDALAARRFQHQKWKLSVAGDQSPANGSIRRRARKAWAWRNSLVQAALRRFDEFHQFPDVRRAVELRADLLEGLRGVELGAQQQAKGALDGFQALRGRSRGARGRPCSRRSNAFRAR